jgi:hypothetical protein
MHYCILKLIMFYDTLIFLRTKKVENKCFPFFRLNLNHNRIRRFPAGFFDLRNLRSLTVAHNGMVELDDEVGRLDQLEQV